MVDLPSAFRRQCEALAGEWRVKLGLLAFDALEGQRLARALSVQIRTPSDQAGFPAYLARQLEQQEDWFGVTLPLDPPMILIRSHLPSTRHESTIMHELAHILLNHPLESLSLTPDEPPREYRSHKEAEAAYLGGCLQIPRRGILWARQLKMQKVEIASHFGASEQMVQWRLNAVKF